jgi:hypothetical protein
MQAKTREELIELFNEKDNWTKAEVRGALASMKLKHERVVTEVRVGDVYTVTGFRHPAVVIKKKNGICYSLTLTTSEDCASILCPCDSRFFPTSFVTISLHRVPEEFVLQNFINPYENKAHLFKIKRLFKQFLTEL